MRYRTFGSVEWEASILGFGLGRLPGFEGAPGVIDEQASVAMIRYAIEGGVNYVDLGYPYEEKRYEIRAHVLRRALQEGFRQKVRVAATAPSFAIDAPQAFDRWLYGELKALDAHTIDFCLLP